VVEQIDRANAEFWNELCGTGLATAAGISGRSPEALARFDREFLSFYPYLKRYVQAHLTGGVSVLEIGLGYGTLGQHIAAADARYYGLDLAEGPVEMMRYRLRMLGAVPNVIRGSAYSLPFGPNSFDLVVSIGCFHHTGHLHGCIDEVHRVLRPRGTAVVMLYNQFSYRQWLQFPFHTLAALAGEVISGPADHRANERQRRLYDMNSKGTAAPETVLVSTRRARSLFRDYSHVEVRKENCDNIVPGGRLLSLRQRCLSTFGPHAGLDLYITARK
jgi:SAM-dependent methyltransferase